MIPTWLYVYLGLSTVMLVIVDLYIRYRNYRHLINQPVVFLELIPPRISRKTTHATTEFFSVIHHIISSTTFQDRLFNRKTVFSFEIVSTRHDGIRYLVRLPASEADTFQQQISAYVPDIHFREVEDYIPAALGSGAWTNVREYKQLRHFAYSLAEADKLAEHDPVAYITGAMTKLADNELLAMQLVVSPADTHHATKIHNQLLQHNEATFTKISWPLPFRIVGFVVHTFFAIIRGVLDFIGEMARPNYELPKYLERELRAKPKQVTAARQEVIDSIHAKLSQPLFQASLRTISIAPEQATVTKNNQGLRSALGAMGVEGYQGLYVPRSYMPRLYQYQSHAYEHRLPAIFPSFSTIFAVSEVASLFHFPYAGTGHIENMVASHSRTLPAPVSLKRMTTFDVTIGENHHHGQVTPIGLTEAERERHMYIIGGTGNGKTTMLQYAIAQDVQAGKGLAVIDPHGDMAETLLEHIPKNRLKDVVYFNPDDLEHPIGLNLLELTPGLTGSALLREKDLVTESVVSVFRKLFSEEDTGGHRIEYVLRNAIQTALTVEGATLFTVLKLLQNPTYRKTVTDKLDDEDLKDFWRNELGQAGNMQRVKMSAGITAKIGRFNSNAAAKLVLGQEKSTVDFAEIMNSGKILICNFSKGLLGEDVSSLFGITVLAKLQLASLRRARLTAHKRRPFYLYVDEFQNFATPSFVQMLSESRKYKMYMTMAEQSTSQQKDQHTVQIILANVGTVVCFRTGNPHDEQLFLPLFGSYIEAGEIANLSAYNFYVRLSSLKAQEPLSGETVLLADTGSKKTAQAAIETSRRQYAKLRTESQKQKAVKEKVTKPRAQRKKMQAARVPGE